MPMQECLEVVLSPLESTVTASLCMRGYMEHVCCALCLRLNAWLRVVGVLCRCWSVFLFEGVRSSLCVCASFCACGVCGASCVQFRVY